jgi:hypothetical protein
MQEMMLCACRQLTEDLTAEKGSTSCYHHAEERKAACEAIKAGRADEACCIVESVLPGLLHSAQGLTANVHLQCQRFIELVCPYPTSPRLLSEAPACCLCEGMSL